jgi:hypothetical protein
MPNFVSSPATVNSPGTYMLRKPRLSKVGLPRPLMKFSQPAGVPRMKAVQPPKIKMQSVAALAGPKLSAPRIPRVPKVMA